MIALFWLMFGLSKGAVIKTRRNFVVHIFSWLLLLYCLLEFLVALAVFATRINSSKQFHQESRKVLILIGSALREQIMAVGVNLADISTALADGDGALPGPDTAGGLEVGAVLA